MSLKPPDSSSQIWSFFYLPGDKILHLVCYFTLTIIYYFSLYNSKKKIFFSSLIAFFLGLILELLQILKIFQRQFDFFDILSNTIGICIAILIIHKKYYSKN
tara:strand:- start:238 stop:543 length:306 start_codon:yes stop_codon:yes gene_type:complete